MGRVFGRMNFASTVEVGENPAGKVFGRMAKRAGATPKVFFAGVLKDFFEAILEACIETGDAQFVLLNFAAAVFPIWIDGTMGAEVVSGPGEKAKDLIIADEWIRDATEDVFLRHDDEFVVG